MRPPLDYARSPLLLAFFFQPFFLAAPRQDVNQWDAGKRGIHHVSLCAFSIALISSVSLLAPLRRFQAFFPPYRIFSFLFLPGWLPSSGKTQVEQEQKGTKKERKLGIDLSFLPFLPTFSFSLLAVVAARCWFVNSKFMLSHPLSFRNCCDAIPLALFPNSLASNSQNAETGIPMRQKEKTRWKDKIREKEETEKKIARNYNRIFLSVLEIGV